MENTHYNKYIKYKNKYLSLKLNIQKQYGGSGETNTGEPLVPVQDTADQNATSLGNTGEQVVSPVQDTAGSVVSSGEQVVAPVQDTAGSVVSSGDQVVAPVKDTADSGVSSGEQVVAPVKDTADSGVSSGEQVVAPVQDTAGSVVSSGEQVVAPVKDTTDSGVSSGEQVVAPVQDTADSVVSSGDQVVAPVKDTADSGVSSGEQVVANRGNTNEGVNDNVISSEPTNESNDENTITVVTGLDDTEYGVWSYNELGSIVEGQPKNHDNQNFADVAYFKHSAALNPGDIWSMKVVKGFMAHVGIVSKDYDPKTNNKAYNITAHLNLSCLREPYNTECGTTNIFNGISQDNKDHRNSDILRELIPENEPYTLSLRIDKDNDVPQLMINDSGTWTDFISGDDRIGLTNGPWFPYGNAI